MSNNTDPRYFNSHDLNGFLQVFMDDHRDVWVYLNRTLTNKNIQNKRYKFQQASILDRIVVTSNGLSIGNRTFPLNDTAKKLPDALQNQSLSTQSYHLEDKDTATQLQIVRLMQSVPHDKKTLIPTDNFSVRVTDWGWIDSGRKDVIQTAMESLGKAIQTKPDGPLIGFLNLYFSRLYMSDYVTKITVPLEPVHISAPVEPVQPVEEAAAIVSEPETKPSKLESAVSLIQSLPIGDTPLRKNGTGPNKLELFYLQSVLKQNENGYFGIDRKTVPKKEADLFSFYSNDLVKRGYATKVDSEVGYSKFVMTKTFTTDSSILKKYLMPFANDMESKPVTSVDATTVSVKNNKNTQTDPGNIDLLAGLTVIGRVVTNKQSDEKRVNQTLHVDPSKKLQNKTPVYAKPKLNIAVAAPFVENVPTPHLMDAIPFELPVKPQEPIQTYAAIPVDGTKYFSVEPTDIQLISLPLISDAVGEGSHFRVTKEEISSVKIGSLSLPISAMQTHIEFKDTGRHMYILNMHSDLTPIKPQITFIEEPMPVETPESKQSKTLQIYEMIKSDYLNPRSNAQSANSLIRALFDQQQQKTTLRTHDQEPLITALAYIRNNVQPS